MNDAGQPRSFYSQIVNPLPVWTTVPAPVVATFSLAISSASATTVLRFEGDSLGSTCQSDNTTITYSHDLQVRLRPTGTSNDIGVTGVQRCNRISSPQPCDDGFDFVATIPAGALPIGGYDGTVILGSSCTTTMWPESAEWHVVHAILTVIQYP